MTEAARLREALENIKRDCGRVCPEFELCDHIACQSSYAAWAIADEALAAVPRAPEPVYEWRVLIERPGLHGPNAFYRTAIRELAELQQRQDAERYRKWEPRTRVWIEEREVGPWERVEEGTER